MSIMSKLILFVFFLLFVVYKIYEQNELSEKLCNEIMNKSIQGIVKNKIRDLNNHGHIDVFYIDLVTNKASEFAPNETGVRDVLYVKIEIGDTLIKESGMGVFYINNYPKRDSVVFNCDM